MSSKLRIPSPLRRFTNGQSELEVHGDNVQNVLEELFDAHPDIKNHLVEDDGSLRNFVNIKGKNTEIWSRNTFPLGRNISKIYI